MGISDFAFDTQSLLLWNQDDSPLVVTSVRTAGDVSATIAAGSWSRYTATFRESRPSKGIFAQGDYKVTFGFTSLTDFAPKPGDKLEWNGLENPARVLAVSSNEMLRYYDLQVRDLVLAYDLRSEVTVYRPTVSADSSGLRSRSLSAVYSEITGTLHADGWQQEPATAGRLLKRDRYTAYLAPTDTLTLLAGDLLDVAGVKYEITGNPVISAIDTLITVTCTRLA